MHQTSPRKPSQPPFDRAHSNPEQRRGAKPAPKFATEQDIRRERGVSKVIGVDEVGRGALAGPICVAAVEINFEIPAITDSKLLSAAKRLYLANLIAKNAKQISFGWATNQEIDRLGLAPALRLAYHRALDRADAELVLTDNYQLEQLHLSKVRGDQYFYSVAAASIIAKVLRDNLMRSYHQFFPSYGWESNVGYGTAKHLSQISAKGYTPLHRKSFDIKNIHNQAL